MFKLGRISKVFFAGNIIIATLCMLVALLTHSSSDPSFNKLIDDATVSNYFGYPGAYISGFIMDIFGLSFYLPMLFVLQSALLTIKYNRASLFYVRLIVLLIAVPALALTFTMASELFALNPKFCGFLGRYVFGLFKSNFEINYVTFMASLTLSVSLIAFVLQFIGVLFYVVSISIFYISQYFLYRAYFVLRNAFSKVKIDQPEEFERALPIFTKAEVSKIPVTIIKKAKPTTEKAAIQSKLKLEPSDYEIPSTALLQERMDKKKSQLSESALSQNSKILSKVLDDFGISGDMKQINPGPVVTLYEFEPQAGIKSSRIIGLADDIARSMSAISARIAVIPGKSSLGIELPNSHREIVSLRELLQTKMYQDAAEKLPLVLGKNIAGEPVIADLAKMPHLLVAGTTGSGKSVAINTMILSLLYKHSPKTCKFVMIDPKMLELSVYDGIPHLLAPVVTEAKKAVSALKWVVKEMERRYKLMSVLGVRNLEGFNKTISEMIRNGEKLEKDVQVGFDTETGKPRYEVFNLGEGELPFIVVIVDEMADLMIVAGKEIEGSIQRLAQMARAAGIHLIMATQRPSVDVITGVIKANFPTRISFQVTSKIDSRTILGEQGAEQLLGMGDMLFMRGGGRLERVHGPFVSDDEVEKVTQFVKSQGAPQYIDTITKVDDEESDDMSGLELSEDDDLYRKAVQIVMTDKKASTSYVQRCLRIGYNRAAILIERMEKEGIISPPNHSGKREVIEG